MAPVLAEIAVQSFVIAEEASFDVPAREALLDRAMGPMRKKKSSEKIRRNRLPADGLALVARDEAGTLIGTVRLWHVDAGIAAEKEERKEEKKKSKIRKLRKIKEKAKQKKKKAN